MDSTMLASFMDELNKIAATNVAISAAVAKPAKLTFGSKPSSVLKTEMKPTNYTTVNTESREAGYGSALPAKNQPPPPIRA